MLGVWLVSQTALCMTSGHANGLVNLSNCSRPSVHANSDHHLLHAMGIGQPWSHCNLSILSWNGKDKGIAKGLNQRQPLHAALEAWTRHVCASADGARQSGTTASTELPSGANWRHKPSSKLCFHQSSCCRDKHNNTWLSCTAYCSGSMS